MIGITLVLAGVVAVIVGVSLVSLPAAFVVAGIVSVGVGLIIDEGDKP